MRFLILILSILYSMPYSYAKILTVCESCTYTTINAALKAAANGDEIIVKSGTYPEHNLLITKSITITGENFPIVDGQEQGEIIVIAADNVTIKGLQIQNVGTSYIEDWAAIRVNRVNNFNLSGNRVYNSFFAIYLAYANDGIIHDNDIKGLATDQTSSGNGIHLWYCKNISIKNNEITGHRDGIYFEFASECIISKNVSTHNLRYGLHFMFSDNDEYSENIFRNNGAGVAVMFSKNINMYRNIFEANWGAASYGLLLKEIYDAEIYENEFIENTIGINLEGATRITYRNNNFHRNGWAIRMSGGCVDNNFTKNNFISNTFDLSVRSEGIDNTFDGNYWSQYNGYDLDRNGIGDVPYRPVKLFSYIVNRTPEAMVLLRSLFIDLLNFSEKISPVFTPAKIIDHQPLMRKVS